MVHSLRDLKPLRALISDHKHCDSGSFSMRPETCESSGWTVVHSLRDLKPVRALRTLWELTFLNFLFFFFFFNFSCGSYCVGDCVVIVVVGCIYNLVSCLWEHLQFSVLSLGAFTLSVLSLGAFTT